jgi:predicted NBD/HSP70 family sugar kinase
LSDAALAGDGLAIEVIQGAADYLGTALATVINLFNPALVVLDGELLVLGSLILEPIRKAVNRHAFSIPLTAAQVVPSALGHRAAAIGASTLVIDRFFTSANGMRG